MLNNPYFLLTLTTLIWAGNTISGKLVIGEIAPMTLVFLRWMLAVLVILPFAWSHFKKDWPLIRPALGWFILYGTAGFSFFNILFYVAANHTSAINMALIQAAVPMLIVLVNWLVFRQRMEPAQVLGLLLSLAGVLFIITRGDWSVLQRFEFSLGDILMLLAGFCYSIYSITLRYKPKVSWLSFILVAAFFALLAATPFAIYEMITFEGPVFKFSLKSLLLVIYIAVFVSAVSQIAYAKGVGLIGANRAGLAINLVPVFVAFMAVFILGESFYWYHGVGLFLVMSGIMLSERFTSRLAQAN